MYKHNTKYATILSIIFVLIIALLLDAFILKDFHFEYEGKISITDIIGLFVTIVLALYIAHVVEEGREKEKAIESIIGDMIQSLLAECDEIQHAVYENHLNYSQASSFSKKIYQTCLNISNIMQRANFVCCEADRLIKKLSSVSPLNKLLTTIMDKSEDPLDYLEVSNSIICDISPVRVSKIQKKIAYIKRDLYSLWAEINLQ
ncbi:MAG: hypothetical protein J1E04_00130 [Alistipes sp.]|nr:hypothetical protein [Alistipes sp.]